MKVVGGKFPAYIPKENSCINFKENMEYYYKEKFFYCVIHVLQLMMFYWPVILKFTLSKGN